MFPPTVLLPSLLPPLSWMPYHMFLYAIWFTTLLIFFQTTMSPEVTEASVLKWQRRVTSLPRATCVSLAGASTVRAWAVTRTRKRIKSAVSKINDIWIPRFVSLAFLHATTTPHPLCHPWHSPLRKRRRVLGLIDYRKLLQRMAKSWTLLSFSCFPLLYLDIHCHGIYKEVFFFWALFSVWLTSFGSSKCTEGDR